MKKILIIDDEISICIGLSGWLEDLGYEVSYAVNTSEATELLDSFSPDLILLDIRLKNESGIEYMDVIKKYDEDIMIIVISANEKVSDAVEAMKKGALEYIQKPIDFRHSEIVIERAFKEVELKREVTLLSTIVKAYNKEIIYQSKIMEELVKSIKLISQSDKSTVFIHGETGTGKELVARAIHNNSQRFKREMVKINCAAISKSLIESELFGYEKNAFTGATSRKKGLLELANEGTIFLDEIAEIPFDVQSKLLRVLEEKKFKRVGGLKEISIDTRIISATNKDLKEMVKNGLFREDLFYRLFVYPIELPPIRERGEDSIFIIEHFIDQFNNEMKRNILGCTDRAKTAILKYSWPGNVREIKNFVERIMIVKKDGMIDIDDLFLPKDELEIINSYANKFNRSDPARNSDNIEDDSIISLPVDLVEILENEEKRYIDYALKETNNNVSKASDLLGISRYALKRKLEKLKK